MMIRKYAIYLLMFVSLASIGIATFVGLSLRQFVDFKVISQVEGKQIKIADQIKMVQYLELLGLKRGVGMPIMGEMLDSPITSVQVEKVNVVYTDKEQNYMRGYGEGGVLATSFGQKYEESSKTMNIYVYVNKNGVEGGDLALSQSFEYTMIQSLFELVNYYPRYESYERQVRIIYKMRKTGQ